MLTIFRHHLKTCKFAAKGRKHRHCNCPIAIEEAGIRKDEYARVLSVDADKNALTVVRADDSQTTYDPRRQVGVTVYRKQKRLFAVGDRIQFTVPDREHQIANGELGTIRQIRREAIIRSILWPTTANRRKQRESVAASSLNA